MSDSNDHPPKLRWPLDVRHQEFEGQKVIILSCPLGLTEKPLGLNAAVGPILGSFDGKLSLSEITEKFKQYGLELSTVQAIADLLDEHYFLDSPRYHALNQTVRTQFINASTRKAALAGLSYPSSELELKNHIDQFLKNGESLKIPEALSKRELIGLVSPHIDYHRGGACYGIAWNALKTHEHDLYILIGTSHQYSPLMFHLTKKDFESPLGSARCDTDFITKLASQYGSARSFADEFLHRREHSLELQIPFLKRLKRSPAIVPILVGGFHHMLKSGKNPSEFEEYENFAASLASVLHERINNGQKICVIAGVDMAHVGRQFGDTSPLSETFMQTIAQRDAHYLKTIESHDHPALFAHVEEDMDARRICGFPTMYTVLDVLNRINLKYNAATFDYRQAVDFKTDCAVTFAGMGLYKQNRASL